MGKELHDVFTDSALYMGEILRKTIQFYQNPITFSIKLFNLPANIPLEIRRLWDYTAPLFSMLLGFQEDLP
jgi:hypothetical protein